MPIGVIARVRIKPGCESRFEEVIARHAAFVRAEEPGNSLYRLLRSPTEPGSYAFIEIYDSLAALETHRSMQVFEPGRRELVDLWDGNPTIEVFETVDLGS